MKNPLAFLKSVGPSLVVAAVVLGPGSITTATKTGAAFGYSPIWMMVILLILLIATASLAARLGATLDRSLCGELNASLGRWAGLVMGIAFFLIVAGFQSSNNMAIVYGIEPLIGKKFSSTATILTLLGINAVIIAILYLSKNLYKQVERIMKLFIGLMVISFLINLVFARPSMVEAIKGLIPDFAPFGDKDELMTLMALFATTFIPAAAFYQGYLVRERGWGPSDVKKGFKDSIFGMCVIVGLTMVVLLTSAATFYKKDFELSVGGESVETGTSLLALTKIDGNLGIRAFDSTGQSEDLAADPASVAKLEAAFDTFKTKQDQMADQAARLKRKEKLGEGEEAVKITFDDRKALFAVVSEVTGKQNLKPRVYSADLSDANKMSVQLKRTFGSLAVWIFCFGFLAGGLSSFLVNAMIGGHVFADGAGFGSNLRGKGVLHATTAALLVGMAVGIWSVLQKAPPTTAIVIAQASTIFGGPAVMGGLLFLGVRQSRKGEHKPPTWMLVVTGIGLLVSIALAVRTGIKIAPAITGLFS
ncbi:MAG: Mn2+/Fe2+ NRAMP family transporter [Verrucomicrobiales bacterium]|jgi:Mn2+/Fe2+ NRAMP family transporter